MENVAGRENYAPPASIIGLPGDRQAGKVPTVLSGGGRGKTRGSLGLGLYTPANTAQGHTQDGRLCSRRKYSRTVIGVNTFQGIEAEAAGKSQRQRVCATLEADPAHPLAIDFMAAACRQSSMSATPKCVSIHLLQRPQLNGDSPDSGNEPAAGGD